MQRNKIAVFCLMAHRMHRCVPSVNSPVGEDALGKAWALLCRKGCHHPVVIPVIPSLSRDPRSLEDVMGMALRTFIGLYLSTVDLLCINNSRRVLKYM